MSKLRGFAAMSKTRRQEVAAMGGRAVPPEKRAYAIDKALAKTSGRIGGINCPDAKRPFSVNRKLAAEAGRKGGQISKRGRQTNV